MGLYKVQGTNSDGVIVAAYEGKTRDEAVDIARHWHEGAQIATTGRIDMITVIDDADFVVEATSVEG